MKRQKKIKEDYLAKARKKAEEKKNIIIQKAAKEAENIRKKAEEDTEALCERAEKTMSEAVKKAAEKINNYLGEESL